MCAKLHALRGHVMLYMHVCTCGRVWTRILFKPLYLCLVWKTKQIRLRNKRKWRGPLQYEDKSKTLMMLPTDMVRAVCLGCCIMCLPRHCCDLVIRGLCVLLQHTHTPCFALPRHDTCSRTATVDVQ